MLHVNVPKKFLQERSYIIEVLFKEFLGIDYGIIPFDGSDYEVILENGNRLIIKDCFFSEMRDGLDYLAMDNIPKDIEYAKCEFTIENEIPVIYGERVKGDFWAVKKLNSNKAGSADTAISITCGIDIFASSFFMLTRWEEHVNRTRDMHKRFPATASIAFRNNFLDRPIVNEYVEMIWNMLQSLGMPAKRKAREFEPVLTCDIDCLYKWRSWAQIFKKSAGDCLKRRDIKAALDKVVLYRKIRLNSENDPYYDSFEWLMNKGESAGLRFIFYFMGNGNNKYDGRYKTSEIAFLIDKIRKRGHAIGLHGSYNSFDNQLQWKKEKESLEKVCRFDIRENRQHYLRFAVPATWQMLEDNGIAVDSTCGYREREGFRCGTADEFSVFNILARKKLNLRERPLIMMDGIFVEPRSRELMPDEIFKATRHLVAIAKKYNSKITLLWHNTSFDTRAAGNCREIYEKVQNLLVPRHDFKVPA